MGIDMRGYKVVYKERVYNALNMEWEWDDNPQDEEQEEEIGKPEFLTVVVINEDNEVRLLHDKTFMFQFVRDMSRGVGYRGK